MVENGNESGVEKKGLRFGKFNDGGEGKTEKVEVSLYYRG